MKLWTNGVFHTMENEHETKYQLATNQGLIIGFDQEIENLSFDEVVDLKGAHVYPGFVDAHMHIVGYGRLLNHINLSSYKTKEDVIKIVKSSFNHEPLIMEGYMECGLTKHDLNLISKDVPILLGHHDYHSITCNDAVLVKVGLSHTNGVLTEDEATRAEESFPPYTQKQIEDFIKSALESLYQFGITGAHSDDLAYFNGYKETLEAFEKVLSKHPFRAHLLMHHLILDDYLASNKPFLDNTPYLQLGAIKMFYDGTLSSKTAYMKTTYKGTDSHGLKLQSDEVFVEMIKKCRKHNLPVAIHIIGDQGTVDVAHILLKYPPKKGLHDRLIHTPWLDDEGIQLMKGLDAVLDIQPQFLSTDLPWALSYLETPPPYIFPWKTLLNAGLIQAGSSDAPVEIPNPLLGIYAAIFRKSDHDHQVYHEGEKLSYFEAISLYTQGANYPTYHQNRGFLKKEYIADFSIFTKNLFTLDETEFKKDLVYMTVVDEQIVYIKK